MERIAFCIDGMRRGGAARVAAILCSTWVEQGHDVHLITFDAPGVGLFYPIDPRVIRHDIGLYEREEGPAGFVRTNVKRVRRVRRKLAHLQPTAVLAFLLYPNVISVIAASGLGIPIVISERNHPGFDVISPPKALLRKLIYPLATKLCVQTEDIRRWFVANFGIDCVVIPNPVGKSSSGTWRTRPDAGHRKRMITLGHLKPQKGYTRLIDAFALANKVVPNWQLVVVGDGPQRSVLEQQVRERRLEHRVLLPGETPDPAGELSVADLYVHSAHYEGFPNAVIEALQAGRCVVAVDCPGAIKEILQDGTYGILCRDAGPEALASGMVRAMANADLRRSFEAKSREAVAHLDRHRIAQQWIDLVRSCRFESGHPGR